MAYHIQITPPAERQLRALPRSVQDRLRPRIDSLSDHPRPPGCKKLVGETDLYRIRVGDYRVLYTVRDKELLVLVVKVGHRRKVYQ